jgi:hypothetical protein
VEVWLHAFLTSARDGGDWPASRLGRFTPRERAPGTHWIGGWVGPRTVLDAVVKRKIPSSRRESNRRTPRYKNDLYSKSLVQELLINIFIRNNIYINAITAPMFPTFPATHTHKSIPECVNVCTYLQSRSVYAALVTQEHNIKIIHMYAMLPTSFGRGLNRTVGGRFEIAWHNLP